MIARLLSHKVTLSLGLAALALIAFLAHQNRSLRDEVVRAPLECENQVIASNEEITEAQLQALRDEVTAVEAALAAETAANEGHQRRLAEANTKLAALAEERRQQRNNDETYADWSRTPIPDGVRERLQRAASGDPESPGGEEDL